MASYVARTPGQKCTCCGRDISDRARGTLYCMACQHIVAAENTIKRKERKRLLEARDAVIPLVPWKKGDTDLKCQVCGYIDHQPEDIFCYHCGQRLKEEKECQTLNVACNVES